MKLSAIVLTHNEEKNIQRCLSSLSFCDEIIIIDDHSTDKTKELCDKVNAKVYPFHVSEDFAKARMYGMSQAKGEWVLYLDADEEVSKKLKDEIKILIQQDSEYQGLYLRRADIFWNTQVKHGEVATAYQRGLLRLMKKDSGTWKGKIHERFISTGKVKTLQHLLLHYPHQTIAEFLQHINQYSTIRAKELQSQNHKSTVFELFFYPLGKFIYTYFLKAGFLDGPAGFVYSFLMAFHSFLVRAKLYQYISEIQS